MKAMCVVKCVLKVMAWMVGVVLVLLLVAIVSLPLWLSPLVTFLAEKTGPSIVGVPVRLDRFYVNPYTGVVCIEELHVGNPTGFDAPEAFSVKKIDVKLDMASLGTSVTTINRVVIDGLRASYEMKDGGTNFDILQENITHAQEQAEANAKAEEAKRRKMTPEELKDYLAQEKLKQMKDDSAAAEQAEAEAMSAEEGKVVIEHVEIGDTEISLALGMLTMNKAIPIPVPRIIVKDIGKESNGATLAEAVEKICSTLLSGAMSGFKGAGNMLKSGGDALKSGSNATIDAVKSVGGMFGLGSEKKDSSKK